MRGLGIHWMDILYFLIVFGGIVAFGYLIALRRRL